MLIKYFIRMHLYLYLLLVILSSTIKAQNDEIICESDAKVDAIVSTSQGLRDIELCYTAIKNNPKILQIKYKSCSYHIEPQIFSNLKNIRVIDLESVCIKEISEEFLTDTPNLLKVSLKSNQIKKIARLVFYGTPIKDLDLSYNQIHTIAKYAFADMNLNVLNLQHNHLKRIDETWFDSSHIKELNLANNKIIRIQTFAFGAISTLYHLTLAFNNIHTINENIGVGVVNTLVLTGNALSDLKFLYDTKVFSLDISFNRFGYFDVSKLVWTDEIIIEPNPWHCSCLRQFWKDATNISINIVESKDVKSGWNNEVPSCTSSKDRRYECKNEMDGDIYESQEYYFELVDYLKIRANL